MLNLLFLTYHSSLSSLAISIFFETKRGINAENKIIKKYIINIIKKKKIDGFIVKFNVKRELILFKIGFLIKLNNIIQSKEGNYIISGSSTINNNSHAFIECIGSNNQESLWSTTELLYPSETTDLILSKEDYLVTCGYAPINTDKSSSEHKILLMCFHYFFS